MAENLFSPEQLKQLQEISKLPGEEQTRKFNGFLKKCTPEQVEYLKQQSSGGECPFCLIKDGKLKSDTLYKDDKAIAVFDINPANKGHILVFPIEHDASIIKSKNYREIMGVVQRAAQAIFDVLKVEGINVLIGDGVSAGQKVAHGYVHVIPRKEGDKVVLNWEKAEISEKEKEQLIKEFSEKLKVVKVIEVKPIKITKKIKGIKFSERIP